MNSLLQLVCSLSVPLHSYITLSVLQTVVQSANLIMRLVPLMYLARHACRFRYCTSLAKLRHGLDHHQASNNKATPSIQLRQSPGNNTKLMQSPTLLFMCQLVFVSGEDQVTFISVPSDQHRQNLWQGCDYNRCVNSLRFHLLHQTSNGRGQEYCSDCQGVATRVVVKFC